MRHRQLHAVLQAFAEDAAHGLAADTAEGAEVPFEIVEAGGRGRAETPLYCYRPLTGWFVRERAGLLGRLPSYPAAARALAALDGVGDYLRAQGEARVPVEPRERADAALAVFVSRVFAEATAFVLTPERFDRAWSELEVLLLTGRRQTVLVAPVLGLRLESGEVPLGDGLSLVRDDVLDDVPPEAVRDGGDPGVLAVFAATDEPGAPVPVTSARARLRRLLTALRLFDDAVPALSPVAWLRTGAGPWQPVSLSNGGRPRGVLTVGQAAEDELRAFCALIARRAPRSGEVAWALARYEMACERPTPPEALTDHLLALRALLEPEGPGSARLPGRVAVLCATEDERQALAARLGHAVALERAVVAGLAGAQSGADGLVAEVALHLRSLLRDVLCGHLDTDLRGLADRLLTSASQPATAG